LSATLVEDYPAFVTADWLYLLMPQSMHAIRVPVSRPDAPWRRVLADHSVISARLRKPSPTPWGVNLVVSHLCNLSCVYCFSEVGHSNASLPLERMLAMVDHTLDNPPADPARTFTVTFFGGEPTLNMPQVRKVVSHVEDRCSAAGVKHIFQMVTNGTAPRSDMDYLIDHGFQLTVSMDAMPERQKEQRIYNKHNSPSDTVGTIQHLADRSVSFRIRSTITGETVDYMDETVRFFHGLGARWVHFEPVGPSGTVTAGRLTRYTSPTAGQYAANLIRAMDEAHGLGVGILGYAFQHLLTNPKHSYCAPMSGGKHYNVLNANGDVIMCPEMQDPGRNKQFDHNVGRVDNSRTVFIDLKRKSEIGAEATPVQALSCQSCYARDICKSGCPSRNIQATGSLTKLDPYSCAIAKQVCADVLRRIADETFRQVEHSADAILRPISMPSELCTPPMLHTALSTLKRAKMLYALTSEAPQPELDAQIRRLADLAESPG
jgi:uncharacterized protein